MTEEIIIDCKYLSKEHSFTNPKGYCNLNLRDCRFVKDCEYKELQHLKQENEKLKDVANTSIIEQEKLVTKVNELAQELELFKNAHKTEQDRRRNFEWALEEIREMILVDNSTLINKGEYVELHTGEPLSAKLQKILNKINEVL